MSSEEIWFKKFTLDYPDIGIVDVFCSDASGPLAATLPVLKKFCDKDFEVCDNDIDAGVEVRDCFGVCIGTYGWRHKNNPIPTVNCSIERDCAAAIELKMAIDMITEHDESGIYPYLSYGHFDRKPCLVLIIAKTKNKEADMQQEKTQNANETTKRRLRAELDRLGKQIQKKRVEAKGLEEDFKQTMDEICVYEAQLEGLQLTLNRLTNRTNG